MLTPVEIESFVSSGFVRLAGAFSPELADQCLAEMWPATGCDPDDPATWSSPVVRLDGFGTPPFVAAANTTALHEAFDQLVGPGRWVPRDGLGTIPVRFPHPDDPGDAGWHVEASFTGDRGEFRVDLGSRGRALLMLFLFSETGPDDAPTRVRVGSHLDVPQFLGGAGDDGREWFAVCADAAAASQHRPVELATGRPGDVYLCHPFLVHAAQPHRGSAPRFMAQPPLQPTAPFDLGEADPPPVVRAIQRGLNSLDAVGGRS